MTEQLEELKGALDAAEKALEVAREAQVRAKKEYDTELLRLKAGGYGAPAPLGTKVYEWRLRYALHGPYLWSTSRSWGKTGRAGILELVTSENCDTFSGSKNVYAGAFVVRLFNANGEPGKDFVDIEDPWDSKWLKWLPEGQEPEKS